MIWHTENIIITWRNVSPLFNRCSEPMFCYGFITRSTAAFAWFFGCKDYEHVMIEYSAFPCGAMENAVCEVDNKVFSINKEMTVLFKLSSGLWWISFKAIVLSGKNIFQHLAGHEQHSLSQVLSIYSSCRCQIVINLPEVSVTLRPFYLPMYTPL